MRVHHLPEEARKHRIISRPRFSGGACRVLTNRVTEFLKVSVEETIEPPFVVQHSGMGAHRVIPVPGTEAIGFSHLEEVGACGHQPCRKHVHPLTGVVSHDPVFCFYRGPIERIGQDRRSAGRKIVDPPPPVVRGAAPVVERKFVELWSDAGPAARLIREEVRNVVVRMASFKGGNKDIFRLYLLRTGRPGVSLHAPCLRQDGRL